MNNKFTYHLPGRFQAVVLLLAVVAVAVMATGYAVSAAAKGTNDNPSCSRTSGLLNTACVLGGYGDFYTELAICNNLPDWRERVRCHSEARIAHRDNRQDCRSVTMARNEICAATGGGRYHPAFGEDYADNFVDPTEIGGSIAPNPYFPLVEGYQWIYQLVSEDEDGEEVTETIQVTVTSNTKEIEGITCVVVTDVVDEDGALVEDTDDWFAQDVDGNVWYCGEIALNYESFEGDEPELPEVTDIDGSWKAGRDGAKAGILFPAAPVVGQIIRQEVAWGEAEDVIEVISTTGSETSPAHSCNNDCLVTRDFTPLEPGVNETKYFAPGVGLILELDTDGSRGVELISFIGP